MLTKKIDPAGTLGERQMAVIKAKLGNCDEVSTVPLAVADNALRIGYDDNEFAVDWEFIGRRLGYRVHSV